MVYWSISVDEISPLCFLSLTVFTAFIGDRKCVPDKNINEIKLMLVAIYLNSYFHRPF